MLSFETCQPFLSFFDGEIVMSKKRFKLRPRQSKVMFSRNARKTHYKNVPPPRRLPMRGGIRL